MKNRFAVLAIGLTVFWVTFALTNHFHIYAPIRLPFLSFERSIPFLPWTVWVYISDYLFLITVGLSFNQRNLGPSLRSYLVLLGIQMLIFVVFPTTFPRQDYAIRGNSAGEWFIKNIIWKLETPSSCFPSEHVSFCFLGWLQMHSLNKRWSAPLLIWAILISLSTLTTKQHYILDVLGGMALAVVVHRFVFLRTKPGFENTMAAERPSLK